MTFFPFSSPSPAPGIQSDLDGLPLKLAYGARPGGALLPLPSLSRCCTLSSHRIFTWLPQSLSRLEAGYEAKGEGRVEADPGQRPCLRWSTRPVDQRTAVSKRHGPQKADTAAKRCVDLAAVGEGLGVDNASSLQAATKRTLLLYLRAGHVRIC